MDTNNNYSLNKISKLEPDFFALESTTIWSFKERGNWATHNNSYRGNWSPYIPRNIIQRYTKPMDIVLDQFVGSGTTLIEAKLLGRKGVGIDINPDAINLTRQHLKFNLPNTIEPLLIRADARDLSNTIQDNSIDLICMHPPYANIIRYSQNIKGDLSLLDIENYISEIKKVANECFRVLKRNMYCAILIGDTRKNGNIVPLGFRVMQEFLNAGFLSKEIIIKEQHNCKSTDFWCHKSVANNFLLIAHEYLFIFRRP